MSAKSVRFKFIEKDSDEYVVGITNRNEIIKSTWKKYREQFKGWNDRGVTQYIANMFRLSERTIWRIMKKER